MKISLAAGNDDDVAFHAAAAQAQKRAKALEAVAAATTPSGPELVLRPAELMTR